MTGPRPLALAALGLWLGCASAQAPICDQPVPPDTERYAGVEVALAPDVSLDPDAAARIAAIARQSARDWLEQRGRLAEGGEQVVEVTLDSARLRPAWVTWLFAWAAPPDHLDARVALRRGDERAARCPARVESAVAGWSWRDREARLEGLARRLGRRVAEGL